MKSSTIRNQLLGGDVKLAGELLGRPYSIRGSVVRGEGRGQQLGFPTANIRPDSTRKLVPRSGVYIVRVELGGKQFFGMLNIGVRPTFSTSLQEVIEVHIFDLEENLYGSALEIYFLDKLRPEKKFASKDDLIGQLTKDREQCMKYLAEIV